MKKYLVAALFFSMTQLGLVAPIPLADVSEVNSITTSDNYGEQTTQHRIFLMPDDASSQVTNPSYMLDNTFNPQPAGRNGVPINE